MSVTLIFAIFPASVAKLSGGGSSTGVVISGSSSEVACSEALEGLVSVLIGNDLVVLEEDVASCVAGVDCQATSILSSFVFRFFGGHTIVKDSVVGDIDSDILVSGLVDNNSVDAVIVGNVVLEVEGSLEVKVARDVDTRAIDDSWLVVLSIVLNTCAKVGKVLSEEEWEAITVSVYGVAIDGVGAASLSFSEDDSRCTSGGPPDGSVDEILGNSDIVAFVAPDT